MHVFPDWQHLKVKSCSLNLVSLGIKGSNIKSRCFGVYHHIICKKLVAFTAEFYLQQCSKIP